ncbi:MAG: NAD(P)-binding domain-containing protein [Weeksellaceae bacterium]
MKIGILGCGWLGQRIASQLLEEEHQVYTTNTTAEKADKLAQMGCKSYVVDFLKESSHVEVSTLFQTLDFIIISVSVSRNAEMEEQQIIFSNIVDFLKDYQGKIVLFSTTGVYPQEKEVITEETYPTDRLHPKIHGIEQIILNGLPQANILRLGGLFGDNRQMTTWYSDVSQISNPNDPVNFVHYKDIIGIIQKLMKSDVKGEIFNVVAPEHPSKIEVFLGRSDHTPVQGKFRIIDGNKLEQLLAYTYIYPNPIHF